MVPGTRITATYRDPCDFYYKSVTWLTNLDASDVQVQLSSFCPLDY